MMRSMQLSELARPLGGSVSGGDCQFDAVSTDTRKLGAGSLFVALSGPNFDGNGFVADACAAGACGAIVSALQEAPIPQLEVADTRNALAELGAINRAAFDKPTVAITGSSGKTSVKEMTAAILAGSGAVLATEGNLNNEIGAPLTLLNLSPAHDYAVIELGASALGEIATTVRLTAPDVAVITNAASAHIEGFGSLDNIVEAKGEIYDGLPESGIGIVNLDDRAAQRWITRLGSRKVYGFSLNAAEADFYAADQQAQSDGCWSFTLHTPGGDALVRLCVPGRHNIANSLAAAACAYSVGIGVQEIAAALSSFDGVQGRLQRHALQSGATLIDDSYNANPESFRAAIDVLASLAGNRILVMGDMAELGEDAHRLHAEVGRYAKEKGLEQLFAQGTLSGEAALAFGPGAEQFSDTDGLIATLRPLLADAVTVLVKGSRSSRMNVIVESLLDEES